MDSAFSGLFRSPSADFVHLRLDDDSVAFRAEGKNFSQKNFRRDFYCGGRAVRFDLVAEISANH
jgi:hypothetical protein